MVANEAKERTRRFVLILGGRYQNRSNLSLAPSEGDNERRGGDEASGTGAEEKGIMKLSELLKRSPSSRARLG